VQEEDLEKHPRELNQMRFLFAITTLLLSVTAVYPQSLASDGYWYYPGYTTPYTRTFITTYAGGWSNGCYTYPTGYYQYSPVTVTKTYDTIDSQMLAIVAAREKYAGEIAKSQAIHQQIIEKAKLYGLDKTIPFATGTPFFPMYGTGYNGFSLNGQYTNTLIPVNGNTQYGYTYNSLAKAYGDTDMNQLLAIAGQLVAGSQRSTDTAMAAFNSQVVAPSVAGSARVAEIHAKRDFALAMIQNLQATPVVSTTGIKFSMTPGNLPVMDSSAAPADVKEGIRKAWGEFAAQSCSACHFGQNIKGGFDLNTFLTMNTQEKQTRVFPRINPSADPAKRMPRNLDGTPGVALTPQQFQLWVMVEPDTKK
jgi:hypothetical protein